MRSLKSRPRVLLLLTVGALLSAGMLLISQCATLDPTRFQSEHYRRGRYHNIAPDEKLAAKGFPTVLKWRLFGPRDEPRVPVSDTPPPTRRIAPQDLIAPEGKTRLTFIGHASVWISSTRNGRTMSILTDPIFDSPVSFMPRLTPLPLPRERLPKLDAVVVSHGHFDHCHSDTLKYLRRRYPEMIIYLPHGMGAWARERKLAPFRIMSWWETRKQDQARISFLPAHHWARMAIDDFMQYHWGSYGIEIGGTRIYFAGDTGYSRHFRDIARRRPGGFDAALMPIGAFAPRWFMKEAHIDPPEAVKAANELGARLLLPIHWGTFPLGDDKPMEARDYLKQVLESNPRPARLWEHGSHLDLTPR